MFSVLAKPCSTWASIWCAANAWVCHKVRVTFLTNFTRQDAAILNVQRACEAVLDMGQHLVRRERLGVPQSARDVFDLLATGQWIDANLADALKRMVAFRNIAVHEYQHLVVPILVNVVTQHLDEFLKFTKIVLQRA